MTVLTIVGFVCFAIGCLLVINAEKIDQGIKAGKLPVTLGEDITGYSYQYAASLVLGWVGIVTGLAFILIGVIR